MAWDNQGGRNTKPKPRGLPTQRSSGIPTYLRDRQEIERARQKQQEQQRQAVQDQQAQRAWQQSQMQQRQNIQDQQANRLRPQNYQGLTDQYGRPIVPQYVVPQGIMDAWGVNQPYTNGLATTAHNTTQLMNTPRTMAAQRNLGIRNMPSRKMVGNTSIYSLNAPSVPLANDNGGGGGGYGDWGYGGGGGGGGGGWNDNYVASWYNSLIQWTFGEPKK